MIDPERTPDAPDSPEPATPAPSDPDHEEFSPPDGDEFDGGRGGVSPEFPGSPDEHGAPAGPPHEPEPDVPGTDAQAANLDPGSAALDDHVATPPVGPEPASPEDLDRGPDRERVQPPNQGFRIGG